MLSLLHLAVPASLILVVGLWAAVIIGRRPTLLQGSGPATIAIVAFAAKPVVEILLNPRVLTDLGAEITYSHQVVWISRALDALVITLSLVALSTPVARLDGNRRRIVVAAWLFYGLRLLSGLIAVEQPVFSRNTLIFVLVVHAAIVGFPDRESFAQVIRPILRLVMIVSLGSAVVAPTWAFIGAGPGGFDRTLFGIHRLTGVAAHPGELAHVAVASLLLELAVPDRRKRWRMIGVATAAGCVLLTQSRTLWLVAGVCLLLLFVTRYLGARVVTIAAIVILGAWVAAAPGWVLTKMEHADSDQSIVSVNGRRPLWDIAWAEYKAHPVIGYGPNFLNERYRQSKVPDQLQYGSHAHNQFFQTAAETGTLGLIALALLGLRMLLAGLARWRRDAGLTFAFFVFFLIDSTTGVPLLPVGMSAITPLVVLVCVAVPSRRELAAGSTSSTATSERLLLGEELGVDATAVRTVASHGNGRW